MPPATDRRSPGGHSAVNGMPPPPVLTTAQQGHLRQILQERTCQVHNLVPAVSERILSQHTVYPQVPVPSEASHYVTSTAAICHYRLNPSQRLVCPL